MKPRKDKRGRKTVMTPEVLKKLEDAFTFSYTDSEACLYADIAVDTLYKYQRENPDFIKRKHALKLTPNIHAKKELVAGIKGNLNQARWWAEHKISDEFGIKQKVEHSGSVGVTDESLGGDVDPELIEARKQYQESVRKHLQNKIKNKANANENSK